MDIAFRRQDDTLVVRLAGEFDLHSAHDFRRRVDAELDESPRLKNLVLVLGDVQFIDSSGLGALLGRYKRIRARGGRVVAVGVNPRVRRVFEASGLLKLIDVADSESRALERV